MKKLIMTAVALAMTLSLGTTAFAASPSAAQTRSQSVNCAFVDADNNGVCDNCKNLYAHNSANRSNGCNTGTVSAYGHSSDSHGSGHHGRNHC